MQFLRSCWFILLLSIGTCSIAPGADTDTDWFALFDRHSLEGWKASEHPNTWRVEEGLLVAHGDRSHLFYQGPVGDHDFRNFELVAEVRPERHCNSGIYFHTAYQESGWPTKGYEVQINNSYRGIGKYLELKRTGSLYGVRNIYSVSAADSDWIEIRIRVVGNRIRVWVDGNPTVDYLEPKQTTRSASRSGRLLSRGTIALQGHDPKSRVAFRKVAIRPLADNLDAAEVTRASDEGYGLSRQRDRSIGGGQRPGDRFSRSSAGRDDR